MQDRKLRQFIRFVLRSFVETIEERSIAMRGSAIQHGAKHVRFKSLVIVNPSKGELLRLINKFGILCVIGHELKEHRT